MTGSCPHPRAPTTNEARLLHTEPCLAFERRTSTGGVPITLVELVHPDSRYQLEGGFRS